MLRQITKKEMIKFLRKEENKNIKNNINYLFSLIHKKELRNNL